MNQSMLEALMFYQRFNAFLDRAELRSALARRGLMTDEEARELNDADALTVIGSTSSEEN